MLLDHIRHRRLLLTVTRVLGEKAVLDFGLHEPSLFGPTLDPDLFSASNADLAATCGRKRPRVVVHAALVGA
jgi:hypothetical protein